MFFQKSIISLFAAIALATSVSASSIALRDYPQCPSGLSPYCCTSAIPFSSLSDGPKTALPGAPSDLDQSKPVCVGGAGPPAQGWCVFPTTIFLFPHGMKWLTCPCSPAGTTPECCPSIVTAGQYFFHSRFGACLLTS